jgi:hypothetical protein
LNQYPWTDYQGPSNARAMQNLEYDTDGNLDTAYISGDMNCDGSVNGNDISAFFLAVGDPAEYENQYPNCNILNGDINGDGLVNAADIDGFFALLGSGRSLLFFSLNRFTGCLLSLILAISDKRRRDD